jgi:hypothetical protein
MKSTRIRSFVAGVLMANSAPHLASALTGHRHLTPLAGRDSSPGVNGAWAALNLAGSAAMLLYKRGQSRRWDADLPAFELGYLMFASWMAISERVLRTNWDFGANVRTNRNRRP